MVLKEREENRAFVYVYNVYERERERALHCGVLILDEGIVLKVFFFFLGRFKDYIILYM